MTSTHTGERPTLHLSLEEIAALVDQSTGIAERRELLEHVSSCEECYELFAETARFVHGTRDDSTEHEPEGDGSTEIEDGPRSGPWGRRIVWSGTLLAAASIALLVLTPLGDVLREPAEILPAAVLAAPLVRTPDAGAAVAETWDSHGWPTMLGEAVELGPEEQRAFRLGVRVFELEVALSDGRRGLAEGLTYRIESLLAADELSGTISTYYAGAGGGIREGLRTERPTEELLDLARQADGLLGPDPETGALGFADPLWYAFGKWAAAGKLAAATGNPGYFSTQAHRRFFRTLRRTALPTGLESVFESLEHQLEQRGRVRDLAQLEESFDALISLGGGGSAKAP